MILSVLILVLLAAIVFFHYLQGLFSATISAILAVLAAVLAMSYHEVIVEAWLRGRMADQASAMVLVALFAAIYLLLRVIFDMAVPGNVRFPALVDKIGGAAMGFVAAVFTTGVLAVAAQELPFGPTIGMFARYTVGDHSVIVPRTGYGQELDAQIVDQMHSETFEPADENHLWVPADEMLVGATRYLSDGGSLAGARSLAQIHPDLLQELFGSRIGIQVGAKLTALNIGSGEQVRVTGVYRLDSIPQMDAELSRLRPSARTLEPTLRPRPDQVMLVVRTIFNHDASDSDSKFRFSPACARLVAGHQAGDSMVWKNYYPVGTLEAASRLYANRVDDPLVVDLSGKDCGADLVYLVDKDDLVAGEGDQASKPKPGVFLEVKRYGRVDLSSFTIDPSIHPAENISVMRKTALVPKGTSSDIPSPGQLPPQPGPGRPQSAFAFRQLEVTARLFTQINVGTNEANGPAMMGSGSASLKGRKFETLSISPTETIQRMAMGDNTVGEFYVPEGKRMVQVAGIAAPGGGDPWMWAESASAFALVDANGNHYQPAGIWAKVKQGQGADMLLANYSASSTVASIRREEGRPTDAWIAFIVPVDTQLKALEYQGQSIQALNQVVR